MATPIAEAYIQVSARTEAARRAIEDLRSSFVKLAAAVGGIYAIKKAGEKLLDTYTAFDREMRNVWTLMDVSEKQMRAIAAQVEELGVRYGQMGAQALKAYYQVVSASFTGAKGIKVLETSMKAAAAGVTDVFTAADALTSILNAYGLSAEEATRVSDVLFTVVKRGKTTMGELAATIGRLTGIAAPAGVSLEELGAALAALTRSGLGTDEAVTAVRAAIVELQKPSEALEEIIHDLGYETGVAALQSEGFLPLLQKIAARARELNIPLTDLFGNIRSMTAVLPLTSELAEEVMEDYEAMRNSLGATDEAFRKVAEGVAFQLDQLRAELTKVANQIGSVVVPVFLDFTENVLEPLVGTISKVVRGFAGIGKLVMKVVPDTEAARASLEEATAAFERTLTTFLAAWAAKRFGGKVSPGLGRLGFVIPFVVQLAGSIVAAIEEPEFGSLAQEIVRALEAAIPGAVIGWMVGGPAGAAVGAALTITIPTLIRLAARAEAEVEGVERLEDALKGASKLSEQARENVASLSAEIRAAIPFLVEEISRAALAWEFGREPEEAAKRAAEAVQRFLEETGTTLEQIGPTLVEELRAAPKAFWEAWLGEMGLSLDEFLSRLGAGTEETTDAVAEALGAIERAREALKLPEQPEAATPDIEELIKGFEPAAEKAKAAQEGFSEQVEKASEELGTKLVPSLEETQTKIEAFITQLDALNQGADEAARKTTESAFSVAVAVQEVKTGAMSVAEFIAKLKEAASAQGVTNETLLRYYEAAQELLDWFQNVAAAQEALLGSSDQAKQALKLLADFLGIELEELTGKIDPFAQALDKLRIPSEETAERLKELAENATPEQLIALKNKVSELISLAAELYEAQEMFGGSTEETIANLEAFLAALGFSEEEIQSIVAQIVGAGEDFVSVLNSLVSQAEALTLAQADQVFALRDQALAVLESGQVITEEGEARQATIGEILAAASAVRSFSTWLDAAIETLERLITAGNEAVRPLYEQLLQLKKGMALGPTFEEQRRAQEQARREAERAAREAARRQEQMAREMQEAMKRAFKEQLFAPIEEAIRAGDWERALLALRSIAAMRDEFVKLGTAVGPTGEALYSEKEVLDMIVGLERELFDRIKTEIDLRRLAGESTAELEDMFEKLKEALEPLPTALEALLDGIREMARADPRKAAENLRELARGTLESAVIETAKTIRRAQLEIGRTAWGAERGMGGLPRRWIPAELALQKAREAGAFWPEQSLREWEEALRESTACTRSYCSQMALATDVTDAAAEKLRMHEEAASQFALSLGDVEAETVTLTQTLERADLGQIAAAVEEILKGYEEEIRNLEEFGLSTAETRWQLRQFEAGLRGASAELELLRDILERSAGAIKDVLARLLPEGLSDVTSSAFDFGMALAATNWAEFEAGLRAAEMGSWAVAGEALLASGALDAFAAGLGLLFTAFEALSRWVSETVGMMRRAFEDLAAQLADLGDRALDQVVDRLDRFRSRLEALITSTEAFQKLRDSLLSLEQRIWDALLGFLWPLVGVIQRLLGATDRAASELEELNVPAGFKAARLEYAAARPGEPYVPPSGEGLPGWVERVLSQFGELIDAISGQFRIFFDTLQDMWETLAPVILEAVLPTLQEFATWLDQLAVQIQERVLPLLVEHLPGILQGFLEFFLGWVEGSIGFVLNLVTENLPAIEELFLTLGGIGDELAELLPKLGEELAPVLGSLIEALNLLATWVKDELLPKVGEWAEQLGTWWEEEVAPFLESKVFPKLQEWLTKILDFIDTRVLPFLKEDLWPFLENKLWPTIERILDKLLDFLERYWPLIEKWFMTQLEQWLTNLQRQIDLGTAYFLSQVGRTFDALEVIMTSESLNMWEKIQYTIALVLQDIGRAIASFFSSPWTWLGIGLGALLLLQEGGVVTRPVVAALAERGRPEAVIPLDRLPEVLFGFQAELRPAAFVIEVPVKIDGREVARAVRKVEFEERLLRGRW